MAKMNIMSKNGHDVIEWTRPIDKTKEEWTAEDQKAVDAAMQEFNELTKSGNRFIDKEKNMRADVFDPNVVEYTMIPNVVGG